MGTNYRIVPKLITPEINPGETAIIDLYITGTGDWGTNKLFFNYSYPDLIASDPGEVRVGYLPEKEGVKPRANVDEPQEATHELDRSGAIFNLPVQYRANPTSELKQLTDKTVYGGDEIEEGPMFDPILGELMIEDNPPIRFRLNTSPEAPPGDYELTLVFIYQVGNELWSDREDVSLHVNNRREQLSPWPTYTGIAAAVIALFSLLAEAGFLSFIIDYFIWIFDFYTRFIFVL